MAKKDFRNIKLTQLDSGQVIKGSFSENQSALKTFNTNSILKDSYTHLVQELDSESRPLNIEYYQANSPSVHTLSFRGDNNGDLAGTYFKMQTFLDKKVHVFYYVVSGNGDEPQEGDFKYAINIATNDPVSLVAYSTRNKIGLIPEFKIVGNNLLSNFIDIEYNQFGETQLIDVNNTGFLAAIKQEGTSTKVGEISLSYNEQGHTVYNGNVLKDLHYNQYSATFETSPMNIGVTIADQQLTSTAVYDKQALDVNIADKVIWDSIETTFPDVYTDLFTYKKDGEAVQTVRVSYADDTKKVILLVEKTRI